MPKEIDKICKWIDVLRAEVSAGIDEIVFDLSRINMDIQLFEKVPDGQKRLNKRVSAPKYTRIISVMEVTFLSGTLIRKQ